MVIFSVLGVQNYGSKDAVSAQQIQVPAFIESVTVYSHKGYVRPCKYTAGMVICRRCCMMLSQHLDVGCPPLLSDPPKPICQYSPPPFHLLQGHPAVYLHHEQ